MRARWPVWCALGAALTGAGVLVAGPPLWLVDRVAAAFPGCLYRVRTGEPIVALTLDDGPDERTTPRILKELRRNGAKATFFLIGERVRGREHLIRRLVAEGHELGNHLMRDRPAILLDRDELIRDVEQSHTLLASYAPIRWARPGSGWYSLETLAVLSRNGYRCALGSVYPWDATIPSSAFASWHILRNVGPGAIIVLHDGGARGWRTAQTLRTVLPELRRRGYRLVTLSELGPHLPTIQPGGKHGRSDVSQVALPRLRIPRVLRRLRRRSPSPCGTDASTASWKHGRRSTPNLDDPPPARVLVRQRGAYSRTGIVSSFASPRGALLGGVPVA